MESEVQPQPRGLSLLHSSSPPGNHNHALLLCSGHALILGNEVADWSEVPKAPYLPMLSSQKIRARCNLPANPRIPDEYISREQDQDRKSIPLQSSQAPQLPPHPPPPSPPPPPKPVVRRSGRPKKQAPLISGIDFHVTATVQKGQSILELLFYPCCSEPVTHWLIPSISNKE